MKIIKILITLLSSLIFFSSILSTAAFSLGFENTLGDDSFALHSGIYVGQPNIAEFDMEANTPNFYKYHRVLL